MKCVGRWLSACGAAVPAASGSRRDACTTTLTCVLALLLLLPVLPAAAQQDDEPLATVEVEPGIGTIDDEAQIDALFDAETFVGMSDEELAWRAYELVERGGFAGARAITEELLRRDRDSIHGHLMLGIVQHLGEGNLPRAFYHVKRSRQLLEERYGEMPLDDSIILWHALAIGEMAEVSGAMGRHEDKIRYLYERDQLYAPARPAQLGWPLMRLRRYDEARRAVEEALALGERPDQLAIARTALCAIEAELQRRDASWEACRLAAEHERRDSQGGPTPFTNAAEAALGMLRFDDAERLILEGTKRFQRGTVSNPWLDLTHLYLAEGRLSEALDSVRRMFRWRRRQPAHVDEQNRSETDITSALFLLVAGRAEEATRVTRRILDAPDRTGYTSSESEQMEAGNALVDSVAQRMAAELAAERASWSPFWEAARARLEARRRHLSSWASGRQAAALVASRRTLLATLRPYLAGSMEVPEWIETEIVRYLGPGVVAAALDTAQGRETLPEAEGYFLAYEAEVAWVRGDGRRTVTWVDGALEALPGSEALLRARLAAIGAQAARDAGNPQRALELFDQVLQQDPGAIRRLGLALPVAFAASPGLAGETLTYLERSPRFDVAGRGWFRVEVEGDAGAGRARLFGPQGTRYSEVVVRPRAGETAEDMARRLAREFHEAVFAPRLDLTQADLRSLDGSPTAAGGRSSERLRSVLNELVGESEDGD